MTPRVWCCFSEFVCLFVYTAGYNESKSETAIPIEHDGSELPRGSVSQHSVSITFGTGKVTGTFVKDKACLKGVENDLGCGTVNMVVANDMSDQPFSLFQFDGILGLGLEALSLGPGFSFFQQMALPVQRFSVFLGADRQRPKQHLLRWT